MKALSLLFTLLLLCFLTVKGQDTVKRFHHENPLQLIFHSNKSPAEYSREHHEQDSIRRSKMPPEARHPTLYLDFGFGAGLLGEHGVQGNYSLNYQYKRSLFTFRGIDIAAYKYNPSQIFDFIPDQETNSLDQYALLYGWRFTNNHNRAFSFSAGIASDNRTIYFDSGVKNQRDHTKINYIGIPFETNYQLYTPRFGVSLGLKLVGDVSKHSFLGFGVVMGLGFHNTPKSQN